MNSKLLIVGGLVLAFVLGTAATSITTAFNKPAETEETVIAAPAARRASAPVVRTRTVTRPAAFVDSTEREPAPVVETQKKRSIQKEVLIVGGSAAGGAAIGAVAGGKKGAAIGAISGGVAGLIYDMATRNK
jgi:hypothetical protein